MFGSNFGPISTYRHNWRNDQPTNQQMRHYIRVISIGWLTVTVWQISTWTIPINRTRRHSLDCIRQVMCAELHWLRVTDRINYKLCLLVYKALHGFVPDYLSVPCILASSVNYQSHLRSAPQGDIIVPWVRQQAFAYAAPCIWNSLPTDLKDYNLSLAVFKCRLKSYFLTRHNL